MIISLVILYKWLFTEVFSYVYSGILPAIDVLSDHAIAGVS